MIYMSCGGRWRAAQMSSTVIFSDRGVNSRDRGVFVYASGEVVVV